MVEWNLSGCTRFPDLHALVQFRHSELRLQDVHSTHQTNAVIRHVVMTIMTVTGANGGAATSLHKLA
jgi:hypothetical protein